MYTDVRKINNAGNTETVLVPPVDIYETEHEYVITADLPAVKKENVSIEIHDNKLEITAKVAEDERKSEGLCGGEYALYNYYRQFNVGDDIDSEKIGATLTDGVLTITLTKREEAKPKRIQISIN